MAERRYTGNAPVRSKKADKSGLIFLGVMLVVVVLVCVGIFGVNIYRERVRRREEAIAQASRPTAMVTFPEGRTMIQYGRILEEKNICTAEEFFQAMRDNDLTEEFDFLPSNEILQSREYPLEGYLYPDTYEFYCNEEPVKVIRRLLNNFKARVADEMIQYADSNGEGFKNIDMSFDKAIILASIIERESSSKNELEKISACFYNRMENPSHAGTGGKLQSDATKYYPYVVGEAPDGFVSEYDTYKISGLPKGPICCPSLSSIRAAVYPDKQCDYYFFYMDKNDTHYYAKTYQQHLDNIKHCKDIGTAW